jgi:hypothetical protein
MQPPDLQTVVSLAVNVNLDLGDFCNVCSRLLSFLVSLTLASSHHKQGIFSHALENDWIILQDMTEKTAGSNDNSDLVCSLDDANSTNDDVYIVHYDLSDVDSKKAKDEVERLILDSTAAGLRSAVRIGDGCSLLIILKAPRQMLGNAIHRSR